MHVEVQRHGRAKAFYLAHSFRDGDQVRKVRRYLGSNLTPAEVRDRRPAAEAQLSRQIAELRRIRDPLRTVLSAAEQRDIRSLIGKLPRRRLQEAEWRAFTELFTYHTNAIEGSTVTLPEVRDILERDRWPNRPKEEIAETYGVANALRQLRRTREPLSLALILKLHTIVFRNAKPFAGTFRPEGMEVAVVDSHGRIIHRGAPATKIRSLLRELIAWHETNQRKYHPFVLASVVHNQFENIHPFQDGNGRVGRLLLNYVLLRRGFPPVNIPLEHRAAYYASLHAYEQGDLRPTIELLTDEYKRQAPLKTAGTPRA